MPPSLRVRFLVFLPTLLRGAPNYRGCLTDAARAALLQRVALAGGARRRATRRADRRRAHPRARVPGGARRAVLVPHGRGRARRARRVHVADRGEHAGRRRVRRGRPLPDDLPRAARRRGLVQPQPVGAQGRGARHRAARARQRGLAPRRRRGPRRALGLRAERQPRARPAVGASRRRRARTRTLAAHAAHVVRGLQAPDADGRRPAYLKHSPPGTRSRRAGARRRRT